MTQQRAIEFLTARLAEDERRYDVPDFVEEDSARGPGWGNRGHCPICGGYQFSGTESVTEDGWWDHVGEAHDYTRWMAEIAAKRAIISEYEGLTFEARGVMDSWEPYCSVMRSVLYHLAAVYKTHPDYQEAWQ